LLLQESFCMSLSGQRSEQVTAESQALTLLVAPLDVCRLLTSLTPCPVYGPLQGEGAGAYANLAKYHQRQNTSDRTMQNAQREINAIGDRLGVTDGIKNEALNVYKKVGLGFAMCRAGHTQLLRKRCKGSTTAARTV